MALVLHLSDLHLDPDSDNMEFGDHKSAYVQPGERLRRHDLLRWTLRKLGQTLQDAGKRLDLIAVTGDVATRGEPKGFQQFQEFLAELGSVQPTRNRIIVIPGNHDVRRDTARNTSARYDYFIDYIRKPGFITPMLDGIDIQPNHLLPQNPDQHYRWDRENRLVIVPINSSHYCGVLEPAGDIPAASWDALESALNLESDLTTLKAIREQFEKLRTYDVPRISSTQLEALEQLLRHIDETISATGEKPSDQLRVALIHHQLLPVSTVEENKPFESIINLGLLRVFLRAHNIRVVLHGHKHHEFAYWDHVYDQSRGAAAIAHRILVVSGATIGGDDYHQEDICRLLEFTSRPNASVVSITPVAAADPGVSIQLEVSLRVPLWDSSDQVEPAARTHTFIPGTTLSEAYSRLRSLYDHLPPGTELANVICRIEDSDSAQALPIDYADVEASQSGGGQEWFDDVVKWWQRPTSQLIDQLHFTHGSRIFRYDGSVDQLARAIELLKNRGESSRAVITLIQPSTDVLEDEGRKFPSFCSVQFVIRDDPRGRRVLDCVGYFRKQELRYWWPVNVGELRDLQDRVFRAVVRSHHTLYKGSITTIAAIALLGKSRPKVAVPSLDRLLDEAPEQLWSMVYALFWKGMPNRQRLRDDWMSKLDDLVPSNSPTRDGVPVPLKGLAKVLEYLEEFSAYHEGEWLQPLRDSFQHLYDRNRLYAERTAVTDATDEEHAEWRSSVQQRVERIKAGVAAAFADLASVADLTEQAEPPGPVDRIAE